MFVLNPKVKPRYEFIGETKTPIIIIDDYALNYEAIIDYAVTQGDFNPDGYTGYPGVRYRLPKLYVVPALKPLIQGLYSIYTISSQLTPAPNSNYFSLITQQPSELSRMQKVPHFDTPNPNLIAFIHYLGKGEHGGTGFFKDRVSGLNKVNINDCQGFYDNINHNGQGIDSLGYCDENNPLFECYHQVDYRPNRLIAFPGQLLHSTLINLEKDIDGRPETGRLTANMFVEFK